MTKLYIPVILGTAHEGRASEKAAKYLFDQLSKNDAVETELVDVRDFAFGHTIPSWEKSSDAEKWREKAQRADGFIIVTPEYNHGYPGELKILLDTAYDQYVKKPVLLCGVSAGGFGGVRVVQSLLPIVHELGLVATQETLNFPKINDAFDESGKPTDPKMDERVTEAFDELLWFTNALKVARTNT
ncbi:NADPH-dependent FMN reductase [Candidatus Wolfebacteria bacterium]|nr:MAG: NADPH-dependent FMN reductase [Candidatus Wolfebacteria bacterium]